MARIDKLNATNKGYITFRQKPNTVRAIKFFENKNKNKNNNDNSSRLGNAVVGLMLLGTR